MEKIIRPRLTLAEYQSIKKIKPEGIYKVIIISDLHGVLLDKAAFNCFLKVLESDYFDEIILNGDICDFPYLSNHPSRLYEEGALKGYSEVNEIEFTKQNILAPIHQLNKNKKVLRLGNHDERITTPKKYNQNQLEKLLTLHRHYETVNYSEMLSCKDYKFTYDKEPVYTLFDLFDITHGLSLSKNAPIKNMSEFMSSGLSSHTHRLNSTYVTNRDRSFVWVESGCMRTIKEVEYFPTAKIPDWMNGFCTVDFYLKEDKKYFFASTHSIINGKTVYNSQLIDGNKYEGI